ncbi:MAG: TonB-dependent receptor [Bacteroides sp.]|nr:TonB-dependent receptor [Bacteroides sp.]
MKQVSRLILLLVALMAGLPAWAASRQVTGTITDEAGEPLIGASVLLVNSQTGCMADIDGNFSLQVPDGNVQLKIALIGYVSQTVKVGPNQNNIKVVMKEDAQTLEETVVVGYGTQKKVNLTGAVASVDGKAFENRPAANITNMLQGSVAGLNVTTTSGLPGSSATLNIRGEASINGGSPLVLIDGSIGEIDNVNPNDVESISVIKDASAAAVYGARAAFGVILVTTKNGKDSEQKATVRYNGRFGWQEPTVSKDYENTGFWSAYLVNKFYKAAQGSNYLQYDDNDMMELLARVNDKTENPDRPWVVETTKSGRAAWKYYGNNDWYDMFLRDKWFSQQHNVSLSGGVKKIRYYLSGGLNASDGYIKTDNENFRKYNLRAKIDFPVNKWITVSNNTSFYGSTYNYLGSKEGILQGLSRHALAVFPVTNPDGSYVYKTDWVGSNNVANGRGVLITEGKSKQEDRKTDFTNVTSVNYTPIKQLTVHGDFTYRFNQNRNTGRNVNIPYRTYPGQPMQYYVSGAGINDLDESIGTYNYYAVNALATYKDTFKDAHNLTVMAGYNYETRNYKMVSASAENLIADNMADFDLVGTNAKGETITSVSGGQNQYSLQGIFGRVNYDYMGKYLVEISGRYDGSSRFAKGNRWGFFPSGSIGWRFSEEKFFENISTWWSNGKIRFSYGTLGNQNVSDYYTFLRKVGTGTLDGDNLFSFGEGATLGSYATLGSPIAGDLSWETSHQYDLGLDLGFFNNRLSFTGDLYIRDTKDMLAPGIALPGVYGANSPKMNVADLRTKGYEFAINWNDEIRLFGHPFQYGVGFNLSDYKSTITKYDNPNRTFAKDYYEGMELGEIWVYKTDGFFKTDAEAQEYTSRIDHSYDNMSKYVGSGWQAGDLKFVDLDGDGKIGIGDNTVDSPGDRYKYGNQNAHLQYGFRANINYFGFDVSAFFQGTGNHYRYPNGYTYDFWGCYSWSYLTFIPTDFKDKIWSEDNQDAYFPRAMGYQSTGGYLKPGFANDRYIQNLRYLRFKNLTVGYTLPQKWTRKALIEKVRIYFTGENLCYWSPLKKASKYVDPEAMGQHSGESNNMVYPWAKSYMFGLDVTF